MTNFLINKLCMPMQALVCIKAFLKVPYLILGCDDYYPVVIEKIPKQLLRNFKRRDYGND